MSNSIETIRVKSGDSYAVINASDFNANEHELYDDSGAASGAQRPDASPPAPVVPEPDQTHGPNPLEPPVDPVSPHADGVDGVVVDQRQ